MFINPEELDRMSNNGTDIVVIGAGPAGITLARRLAAKQKKILLIEAGGLSYPSEAENDPYAGHVASRPYPLMASRLRYFGGSSNHWGGWVRPLDREDFEINEGIPFSGWPINYDDMKPYYTEAHNICEVKGDEYSLDKIDDADKLSLFEFADDADFRNSIFRFSPPTRFGERYRQDIKQSPNIFCALNTQLLHIERNSAGHSILICLDSHKNRVAIVAKRYVLAMGGIENARTLLYSSAVSRSDLGGDWVGRCFADHSALTTSLILARPALTYDRTATRTGDLMARVSPSRKMLNQPGVGNLMVDLYPTDADKALGVSYFENPGFFNRPERGWHYSLRVVLGQRPNRNSRVRLDKTKDANGVPRVKLDWNIAEEDFQNAFSFINKFSTYIGATGQGRLKVQMETAPEPSRPLGVGMHHIGTTRMASSKNYGVVDENCKVFGTSDLYVSGSSVFPTTGYSNPTLTIIALAVRLAGHLESLDTYAD